MKYHLFISLVMAVLLSLITSEIVYFGFTPNYANDIFSRKAYANRHDHDVYKYRILGKYLVYAVDSWLAGSMPEKGAELRLMVGTKDASERFYLALYYLNSIFLVLTSIMVVLLLNLDRIWTFTVAEKNLVIFLVPILIGLTEFTVSVYDVSSFFYQLLILYIFFRWINRHFWRTLVAIAALFALSTLNRETSALSVSLVSLLLLTRFGITPKTIAAIAGISVCFLLTYAGLRWFVVDPHILTCLKDGVLWEVRLYVPLFLGSLFLSKLNASANALRIGDLVAGIGKLLKKSSASGA